MQIEEALELAQLAANKYNVIFYVGNYWHDDERQNIDLVGKQCPDRYRIISCTSKIRNKDVYTVVPDDSIFYEEEDYARLPFYLTPPDRSWFTGATRTKMPLATLCEECERYYADPPSRLCPGCEAYREHQR